MGAEAFLREPDGPDKITQVLIHERIYPEVFGNLFYHGPVTVRRRIGIFLQVLLFPLKLFDGFAAEKISTEERLPFGSSSCTRAELR